MKQPHGFTLLELMITLVIIAILAAAAYPSYASYVVRARRAEGQIALIDAMQKEERYYTQHNTYLAFAAGSSDQDAHLFRWFSGASPARSAYELRAEACPGSTLAECVSIQANPGTSSVDASFRDPECGTLTLHSSGERSASGAVPGCWP